MAAPAGSPHDNVDTLSYPNSIVIVGALESIDRISGRLLYYHKFLEG